MEALVLRQRRGRDAVERSGHLGLGVRRAEDVGRIDLRAVGAVAKRRRKACTTSKPSGPGRRWRVRPR
jgi:hypothetical protein